MATGPSGGFTDIVKTVDNSGFYIYSNGINLHFRLRIGGIISGSKGYSVLIDTDGRMGNSGRYADPNYQAPTNTSNGNPGFEYEVVFQTNFRVEVYDVNGPGNPVSTANFPLSSHSRFPLPCRETEIILTIFMTGMCPCLLSVRRPRLEWQQPPSLHLAPRCREAARIYMASMMRQPPPHRRGSRL